MKKVLIISPHFPPSNLAAVHRSRLFAQHLPGFGWEPIILTVDERFYEEQLDHNLSGLLPANLRIEKVNAFRVTKPRIVGDIGLRGFFQLYKKAKSIIKSEKIDFLYIPIPSFYVALLGRMLNRSTGIPYGIDYIDPWVHRFPGSDKLFSRHWLSTKIAALLEPIAIKKASLITGVASGYFEGVKQRNPNLASHALFGAMPYGGEKTDHDALKKLSVQPYLFKKNADKIQLVYAGAMLPKAYGPLEAVCKSIKENPLLFSALEIHFIGTGSNTNDSQSFNIKPVAERFGLWEQQIFEYPARIPYLDVLVHLDAASGVFVLGSTESHYTPSKVYQGVLSGKPLLAVLHKQSSACAVIRESNTGIVVDFDGEHDLKHISSTFPLAFSAFTNMLSQYTASPEGMAYFDQYSAKAVTGTLAALLDKAIQSNNAQPKVLHKLPALQEKNH